MNVELIGLISVGVATIGGWGTTIIKGHYDKISSQKELSKRDSIITDSLRGVETEVIKMGMAIKELKDESEFDKTLRNAIKTNASLIASMNFTLDEKYTNILMYVAQHVKTLAFEFFYCPYRNNPKEMERYLSPLVSEKRAETRAFINHVCKDLRWYGKTKVNLSDFLSEVNVFKYVELLILELVRNGLDKPAVIRVFSEFMATFAEKLITSIQIYESLEHVAKDS